MKISVALIVKNEKDHIETVLRSVEGADEIVVCDTGSEDNTVELAKKFTDKVFTDFVWCDDFATARNHALSKCTGDWVLSIDADEVLEKGGIDRIRNIIASAGDKKTFSVVMKGGTNVHYLPRIFVNDGTVKWMGAGHEALVPSESNKTDIIINYGYSTAHQKDPDRMLRILQKEVEANPQSARDQYYLGREYWYRKEYATAAKHFEQCVAHSKWNPERSDAFLYLAQCYFQNYQGEQARDACLRAIQINPDFKEALLYMAELHFEPWKRKWLQFASLATNENVLFVRNAPSEKPLDMSEMDILAFKNILAGYEEIDVLEWGSGNSTKYFTKFLASKGIPYTWDAVEHDKSWYEAIRRQELPNVNMIYAERDSKQYYDMNRKYDVIFVDGRNRRKCLIKAKQLLKPGGVVLLHDADREYYHPGFEGYHGKILNPKNGMPRLWKGTLEPRPRRIPKFIHQIWIGDQSKRPQAWLDSWKDKHPGWEYILWDEEKIEAFGLKNKALYDRYYAEKCYNGAANVARVEILERLGGVYMDADSECLESMEGAVFLDWDIFSVYEADNFFVDGIRVVANGIIGAIPAHPLMQKYIKELGKVSEIMPSWKKTGPFLWSKIMNKSQCVLPPYTFLPEHHSGTLNRVEGTIYGRQFWGTSKNIY